MATPATSYLDEWTTLRARLAQLSEDDLNFGYFTGYVPKSYASSGGRILYVCASVPGYLADVFGPGPHPLKDDPLATEFARALGGLANGGPDGLENIAVTSFCKVALQRGEVGAQLFLTQQQLAVQTLRYEMYALDPRLVVFVRETVNALRGSRADLQVEGEGTEAIGFRTRGDAGEPAVLVLQPPGAVSKSVQANWLARAANLLR